MASIHNPTLEIIPGGNHPGRRVLRVSYDLIAEPGDDLVGTSISETIVVHGRDLHDAPVDANSKPIATRTSGFTVAEGTGSRTFEVAVDRVSLDVEQDWWSTGLGGETQPIAEWIDHIVAVVELSHEKGLIDRASTPVVTGSWGALGTD